MKTIVKTTIAALLLISVISCKGFLDPYPSAIRDEAYVLSSPTAMQGLLGECYEWISSNYNNNEGAYLDCLTDNAVMTSKTDVMSRFAIGVTSPANDPFQTYWTRDYQGIYNANLFLKDGAGRKLRYMLDDHRNELLTDLLWGEAYALRAWFQWDLLQKFGGRSTGGELLGFPIITEPIKIWTMTSDELDALDLKRNSYEACVKQIIADCDSAYKYLPLAHRDFLVKEADDLSVLGSRNWGRLDGISTVAIKALLFQTWASPLFNPEGDMSRWEKAAQFAKEVIDFKIDVDGAIAGGFRSAAINWFDPNNPEIIFGSRYNSGSEAMEKMFYPGGLQGNGTMGATQDFVDAFGMADGYPLGKSPKFSYDPQNPYENRDARLYSNVFYNGRTIRTGNSGKTYVFENHTGGKDEAEVSSNNTRTNYYIKKFVYDKLNWSESNISRAPHSKFLIRWTHMLLTFAEAANHIAGPTGKVEGLTAKEVVSWIRSRKTYDGEDGLVEDPYLEQISVMGEKAFDAFLRNERRIETAFEGTWFFDLRRWSTSLEDLNETLYRPAISRRADGSFEYDYDTEIERRVFTSAFLPIPYKEMVNVSGLVQNEGWESWTR